MFTPYHQKLSGNVHKAWCTRSIPLIQHLQRTRQKILHRQQPSQIVERIGGDFLRIRGLNNRTGSMYEAAPESECFTPGGNLIPLASDDDYRCAYA
jgi:hypothetical protein